jgi:hypothetical protein
MTRLLDAANRVLNAFPAESDGPVELDSLRDAILSTEEREAKCDHVRQTYLHEKGLWKANVFCPMCGKQLKEAE